MKKIVILIAVFISALTNVKAQTVDDIINNYIKALGGREKLAALKNVYIEASINAQGSQIPIKIWQANKIGMRTEFEVNGMKCYNIVTKDSGWNFMPIMGQTKPEPLTADLVKMSQPSLDLEGSLVNYKEKGNVVEYMGKDEVDGTEALKLIVTLSTGAKTTYFLDPNTYYIIREVSKTTTNGMENESKTDLSNYAKNADGYLFPMNINSPQGDIKISQVKTNTTLPANLFSPSK